MIVRRQAWIFTILASVGFFACLFLPWQRAADFDVIGILFLMQNIVPLTVAAATFFCLVIAIGCWWRTSRGR